MINKKMIHKRAVDLAKKEKAKEKSERDKEKRKASKEVLDYLTRTPIKFASKDDLGRIIYLISENGLKVERRVITDLINNFYTTGKDRPCTLQEYYIAAVDLSQKVGMRKKAKYFERIIPHARDAEIGRDISSWR